MFQTTNQHIFCCFSSNVPPCFATLPAFIRQRDQSALYRSLRLGRLCEIEKTQEGLEKTVTTRWGINDTNHHLVFSLS